MENSDQVHKLIDRLVVRTESGAIKWRPLSDSAYEVRLGNFSMTLRGAGQPRGLGGKTTTLDVKRLDGKMVASVTTGPMNALSAMINKHQLSGSYSQKLDNLFELIDNRDEDLDEILKLLD